MMLCTYAYKDTHFYLNCKKNIIDVSGLESMTSEGFQFFFFCVKKKSYFCSPHLSSPVPTNRVVPNVLYMV